MISIRYEDMLDEVPNYIQWKFRIIVVLKDNNIWHFFNTIVKTSTDPNAIDIHEVNEAKEQRIILHGLKYHLIPHIVEKNIAKDMWDTLKNIFEAKN